MGRGSRYRSHIRTKRRAGGQESDTTVEPHGVAPYGRRGHGAREQQGTGRGAAVQSTNLFCRCGKAEARKSCQHAPVAGVARGAEPRSAGVGALAISGPPRAGVGSSGALGPAKAATSRPSGTPVANRVVCVTVLVLVLVVVEGETGRRRARSFELLFLSFPPLCLCSPRSLPTAPSTSSSLTKRPVVRSTDNPKRSASSAQRHAAPFLSVSPRSLALCRCCSAAALLFFVRRLRAACVPSTCFTSSTRSRKKRLERCCATCASSSRSKST